MQDYYDKEIYDKEQSLKQLKFVIDSLEKQQARDLMIIKFRDSTISRRDSIKDKLADDDAKVEFENLAQEINNLREQLEDNPKLAKSYAEITDLKQQIANLSSNQTDTEFQTKESVENLYKS